MTRATTGAAHVRRLRSWLAGMVFPLLGVIAACGSESQPDHRAPAWTQTPAPSATIGLSPTATALPADPVAAGMEALERAVLAGDEEAILSRFAFSAVPCSNDTWPMPVCDPGRPEGSTVQRLPFVGCEAVFLTDQDLRTVLRQVLLGREPAVYAKVSASGLGEAPLFPLGPVGLVFETQPPPGLIHPTGLLAVLDAGGRVISLRTGCRATPQGLVETVPGAEPIE